MTGQAYVDAVVAACVREVRPALAAYADDLALDVQAATSFDDLQIRLTKRLERADLAPVRSALERLLVILDLAGRASILEEVNG